MKPDPEEPPPRWIQITDGPIRWVELGLGTLKPEIELWAQSFLAGKSSGLGFGTLCYVPDTRITQNSARVRMVSDRVKSFLVFGRTKRVRWQDLNYLRPDLDVPGHIILSENLGQNLAATEANKSLATDLCVVNDPDSGCWILAVDDRPISQWTREVWDGCQAMAEALLAMPMSTED